MYLDKSLASEQLVILDCCHSGSFSSNAKAVAGESVGTKGIFYGEGRGRVVLTASDETSYAYESDCDAAATELLTAAPQGGTGRMPGRPHVRPNGLQSALSAAGT